MTTATRLPTGEKLGNEIMHDTYEIDSQDVNVFTLRPKWSKESAVPAVGCVCDGRFYFLRCRDGSYDAEATRHNLGKSI